MEARPEQAHRYAVETVQRTLDGMQADGPPCTSASALRRSCPSTSPAASSWPSSPTAPVDQISIETAQANLDVSVLSELSDKTIILGCSRSIRP